METEGTIIYVAGNPDLYPAEYYDAQSGTYQGAIPDFLRAFAEEYGYDLRYLRPGEEDLREELAKNQQVDVISGCEPGSTYAHTAGQPLLLFPGEGGEYYTLCLTQVASPQVQSDLRAYVEAVGQGEWTEAILQAAGDAPAQPLPAWALWGAWSCSWPWPRRWGSCSACAGEKSAGQSSSPPTPRPAWAPWRSWKMPSPASPGTRAARPTA